MGLAVISGFGGDRSVIRVSTGDAGAGPSVPMHTRDRSFASFHLARSQTIKLSEKVPFWDPALSGFATAAAVCSLIRLHRTASPMSDNVKVELYVSSSARL